ncbi:MAG: glycosyltransferase family 1 protein [Firmicutes bacterium]|nr:glycosyltransferase family 1 protein [Bacillota bacterium]
MRLAMFTDTYYPQVNGVARTLERVSSFLHRQGIPHLIFAPRYDTSSSNKDNVYLLPAIDLPMYPECKVALPNYFHIRRTLDSFKPDLLYLVTEFSMGLCGLKYAKERGLPVAAAYTTNFPDYLAYYRMGLLKNWAWKYLQWFHNQCHLNLCPSHTIKSTLNNKGFKNLEVWGRGVETDSFCPGKQSDLLLRMSPGKKLFLLYVGRFAPEKDLDVLFEAWRAVSQEIPEAQLVMTGDGPIAEELKKQYQDEVVFTGYRHGEELASIYASSQVFVFPSTTETFGNVVLEAMASGLPVVGPAAGGVKNLIIDGVNGISCTPRDHQEMAAAIIRLARDHKLRQRLGNQARDFALNRSWETLLKNLNEIFQGLVIRQELSERTTRKAG